MAYQPLPQPYPPLKTNGFAITAFVLGIGACCLGLIPVIGYAAFPMAIIGVVFGVIAIVRARRRICSGLVLASVATVFCALGLAFAVIGVVVITPLFHGAISVINDIPKML